MGKKAHSIFYSTAHKPEEARILMTSCTQDLCYCPWQIFKNHSMLPSQGRCRICGLFNLIILIIANECDKNSQVIFRYSVLRTYSRSVINTQFKPFVQLRPYIHDTDRTHSSITDRVQLEAQPTLKNQDMIYDWVWKQFGQCSC